MGFSTRRVRFGTGAFDLHQLLTLQARQDAVRQPHRHASRFRQVVNLPLPLRFAEKCLGGYPGLAGELRGRLVRRVLTALSFAPSLRSQEEARQLHAHVPESVDHCHAALFEDLPGLFGGGLSDQKDGDRPGDLTGVLHDLPRCCRVGGALGLHLDDVRHVAGTDHEAGPPSIGQRYLDVNLWNVAKDPQCLLLEGALDLHDCWLIHNTSEYS